MLLSFMVGLVVFFGLRYVAVFKDKIKAEKQLSQASQKVMTLEGQLKLEKELGVKLNEEKLKLEASLKDSESKISKLTSEQAEMQERIFSIVKEIEGIKKFALKARLEKAKVEEALGETTEENIQLKIKLRSIPELKKVIRELKIEERKARRKPKLKIQPKTPVEATVKEEKAPQKGTVSEEGNEGFVIKDGSSTYKPQLSIEVRPAL